MVPKSKDWIERLDPDIKLPNFNTGRIMVPERQAVIESLKPTKASTDPVSSSDSVAEPITPLPLLNILQGALPSLKDHLRKFDAKADDGYFLGYSFVSKSFRVLRRQQIKETYHVTFDESMDAIRFTHTLEDEIGNDDSSRYPPDKFLSQENHVPEVIAPNELDIPHTEDTEGLPDLINTEGTPEQNVQNDQLITQPTDVPSGNNTEVSGPITKSLVHDAT
nr:retrovirus-related Pol polyprotein from transposon TNT 1-94 [Tanacetum cinerariifolium]